MAAVICDQGSGIIKAGFAGDAAPSVVLPAVVGLPKMAGAGMMAEMTVGSSVIPEALEKIVVHTVTDVLYRQCYPRTATQ